MGPTGKMPVPPNAGVVTLLMETDATLNTYPPAGRRLQRTGYRPRFFRARSSS